MTTPRAALIGKLPAHGDFVARGVSAAQRTSIDDWLAGSMADAHDRHGAAFDALFDAAPPWRFVRAGPDSDQAGALVASVDSVGRRFPLMLWIADGGREAAETAEALAYAALAGCRSADWLHQELEAKGRVLPPAPESADESRWWIEDADGTEVATLAGAMPPAVVAGMLDWAAGAGSDGDAL